MMHNTVAKSLLWLLISLFSYACSIENKRSFNRVDEATLNENERKELERLISEELEKRGEDGELNSLEGFTKTEKLDPETNQIADNNLRELSQSDEQIFEFVPPEGIVAEFSEPVMITGSSLFLSNRDELQAQCEGLEYIPEEPTMATITRHAQERNTCGDLTLYFCIRISVSSEVNRPNYAYTQSPDFKLTLPCSDRSFDGINIDIAGGASHTRGPLIFSEKI